MKPSEKIRRYLRLTYRRYLAIYFLFFLVGLSLVSGFCWVLYKAYYPQMNPPAPMPEKIEGVEIFKPEPPEKTTPKVTPPKPATEVQPAPLSLEKLMEAAKNSTDPEAIFALAEFYEKGTDLIPADRAKSLELFNLAADLGLAKAQYKIALLHSESLDYESQMMSMNYFAKAANQGYAPAELELANIYLDGAVVDADYPEAMRLYELAAAQGLASAELNLGLMYQKGLGVESNPSKAVAYYELAAAHGQSQAQYNLGVAYFVGYGVEKNVFKAKEWLNEALRNGNKNALSVLEQISIL